METIARPAPGPSGAVVGFERYRRLGCYWATVGWNLVQGDRSPSFFVLGAPRTGASWFCRILSHHFRVPIYLAREHVLPVLRPTVLHLHRFAVVPSRTIYMVRDARDSTVSFYHKSINTMPDWVLEKMSGFCDAPVTHENVRVNLPGFFRFLHEGGRWGGSMPFTEHLRLARERGLYRVRYEALLGDGEKALSGAVTHLTGRSADPLRVADTLEATSFERRTGRKRGMEDLSWPSVRKGIAGDWKNHFTRETARVFDHYAGDLLVECGYEPDRSWVERVEPPADR